MSRFVFALAGLLLLAGSSRNQSATPQQTSSGGATLLTGARLITDGDKPPMEDSAFLVEGDKITKVGKRSDVRRRPGTKLVDLTGKTVIRHRQRTGHLGFIQRHLVRQSQLHPRKHHQSAQTVRLLRRRRDDDGGTDSGDVTTISGPTRAGRGTRAHGRTRLRPCPMRAREASRCATPHTGETDRQKHERTFTELAGKKPD